MDDEGVAPAREWDISNEPLSPDHDVAKFDCGIDSLNLFIHRHALTAPQQGLSQTWVTVTESKKVLAYHTLAISTVSKVDATNRLIKGLPNYAVPCVLLARLAVDRSIQGDGLGRIVLETALRKAVALGRMPRMADGTPGLPMRAMLVHAIDGNAARFYQHHGFESSPTDPLHLLMLLKDIEQSLRNV